jgi:hypothetical protein
VAMERLSVTPRSAQQSSSTMCRGVQEKHLRMASCNAAHLALLHQGDGQLLEVAGGRRRAHEGLHLGVLNAVHVQRERTHCRPHLSTKSMSLSGSSRHPRRRNNNDMTSNCNLATLHETHHAVAVADELDALCVQREGGSIVGIGPDKEELDGRLCKLQADSLQQVDVVADDLIVVEVLQQGVRR